MTTPDGWTLTVVASRLNDQPLPASLSGDLSSSKNKLTMPYVRGSGAQIRSCEHALTLAANVIFDIQPCRRQQPTAVTQVAEIADRVEAKLPR